MSMSIVACTDTDSNVSNYTQPTKQQKFHRLLQCYTFLYSVTPTQYNKKQHAQQCKV